MKQGTNYIERNYIRAYVNAGQTNARIISERLNLDIKAVQSFIDSLTPELTRGQKAAATRAANKETQSAA